MENNYKKFKTSNAAKNFDISATNLSVLHYFDSLIKLFSYICI